MSWLERVVFGRERLRRREEAQQAFEEALAETSGGTQAIVDELRAAKANLEEKVLALESVFPPPMAEGEEDQ